MSEISLNRYAQIITEIFRRHFQAGMTRVPFEREALRRIADELGIPVPKNLGDVLYSFKYRAIMPSIITETAPEGYTWTIKNEGQALYAFVLIRDTPFTPNPNLIAIKIPDATPGIIGLSHPATYRPMICVYIAPRFTGEVNGECPATGLTPADIPADLIAIAQAAQSDR